MLKSSVPLSVSALDLAQNSNVQDAFVIAVEQQARERLEKLSALRKIKPVDMTRLSQQVGRSLCSEMCLCFGRWVRGMRGARCRIGLGPERHWAVRMARFSSERRWQHGSLASLLVC